MEPHATRKGAKVNPPSAWGVWSLAPTHEPIVTRELFDAALEIAGPRKGSRNRPGPNSAQLDTRRSNVLRSFVVCDLCGRKMFGKTRRGHALLLSPTAVQLPV